jgi:hypothetical protein
MTTIFGYLEPTLFTIGLLLVLLALFQYIQRTQDYQSIWRVLLNKLKEGFTLAEFKIYRLGVAILIFGLVIRLVNQIFFPSYW